MWHLYYVLGIPRVWQEYLNKMRIFTEFFILLEEIKFYEFSTISIGNRTISSTIWKLIDTSNVLKVLVIARADRRVQFKNFQNITSVY